MGVIMTLKLNLVVTKVVPNSIDLDFKTYDGTYKDKLANIKKYTNSKGKISFVPTVNVVSTPDLDYPRMTLKAGKEVNLNYPDLMINGDGEYVVEVEGNNGHVFQVPYNQITGWKRP